MKHKNVLVTGCAGFIGANFVRYLLNNYDDIQIIGLDALLYAGSQENVSELDKNRFIFIHGSTTQRDLIDYIMKTYEVDLIVNFAAESHVDRSILEPENFIYNNIVGTVRLMNSAMEYWIDNKVWDARFIHISTDEVFGSLDFVDDPWDERSCHLPNTPYSATKSGSDMMVRSFCGTYNFPAIILNCGNNYGPYQFPEKFIPMMIDKALTKKPMTLHGDGQHIRDWIYVDDFVRAILAVIDKGYCGESYNVGGGIQPTNLEVLELLCEIFDVKYDSNVSSKDLITFIPDRPNNDLRYDLDTTKITVATGWMPEVSLWNGLEQTVSWYLKNTNWMLRTKESIRSRNWRQWEDFRTFPEF